MKAFLAYTFKDNVTPLIDLLRDSDVEVFDSMTDLRTGNSLQSAIKKAILDCDFLVLVYTNPNPNIAFEAGLAVSMNKPILSVVSEKENYPDFLFESTYVNSEPDDIEKIEFNLNIFLDKIKPKKRSVPVKSSKFYGGGYASHYYEVLDLYKSIKQPEEKSYEELFKRIFDLYKLKMIENEKLDRSDFIADFCIWSDQLSNVLGNPILVEIKKVLTPSILRSFKETIERQINNQSAESCLVFYDKLHDIEKKDLPNSTRYMFIEIKDFISSLDGSDFDSSIRQIRNRIAHNRY